MIGARPVFALPRYTAMLEDVLAASSALAAGACTFSRFANGELYLRLGGEVRSRSCAVLGSLAPPDEQLLSVLALADTLRREGAAEVAAALPYLGYARQDRAARGQSVGARWVGRLLAAAGIARVITLDVHSTRAEEALGLAVRSLSPSGLFAHALAREGTDELSIVAPDEGALGRCEAVRQAAGITAPVAFMRKRRHGGEVTHGELVGGVGRRAALVDDILDTGSTLVSACLTLRRAGVEELIVLVTHGLFTGEGWLRLAELGVSGIYITDSIPGTVQRAGELVHVLPAGPLLGEALAAG